MNMNTRQYVIKHESAQGEQWEMDVCQSGEFLTELLNREK